MNANSQYTLSNCYICNTYGNNGINLKCMHCYNPCCINHYTRYVSFGLNTESNNLTFITNKLKYSIINNIIYCINCINTKDKSSLCEVCFILPYNNSSFDSVCHMCEKNICLKCTIIINSHYYKFKHDDSYIKSYTYCINELPKISFLLSL